MTNSDRAPSSIRDDSICESSLNPNKSSGDIVERLCRHVSDRGGQFKDDDGNIVIPNGAWQMMIDAAAEIERLRRIEAAHQQQIIDAGEIMKHWQSRALSAESAVAAADSAFDHLQMHSFEAHHNVIVPKIEWDAASAIRAAVSKKTAED